MKMTFVYKGGEGSGFHGHAGRPGEVGGSALTQREYRESIQPDVKKALKDYTTASYKKLNKDLRASAALSDEDKALMTSLDDVLANSPEIEQRTLYRALYMTPDELGYKVGETVTDKAYMSTSRSARYMYTQLSEAKTRVTIKVPKGYKGLDLTKITNKPAEQEVLLSRNTSLKIKSIIMHGSYYDVKAEIV